MSVSMKSTQMLVVQPNSPTPFFSGSSSRSNSFNAKPNNAASTAAATTTTNNNSNANSSTLPPVAGPGAGASNTPNSKRRRPTSGIATFQTTPAKPSVLRMGSPAKRSMCPPQLPKDSGKITLVLDVDETLIHSRLSSGQESFRQDEERKYQVNACDEFKITLEDGEVVWVNKRPGLDRFLEKVSELYEPIVYTAGLEEYAKPLLDWLDPENKIFRHRFYRDSCVFAKGYYVKDLNKCNRDVNRTVLVDNNAFCFLPQLSNGIPISSFYDDPNDTALDVLLTFLDRLDGEQDVRPFLRQSFNLETLLKDHKEQIIG